MKIKVIKSRSVYHWYSRRIGEVFDVSEVDDTDYRIDDIHGNGTGIEGLIWLDDAEVVEPDYKIVEHDGVKYKVPGWANYITRDKADDAVYCFDVKPEWSKIADHLEPEWHLAVEVEGRVDVAEIYVETLPAGNFFKEI